MESASIPVPGPAARPSQETAKPPRSGALAEVGEFVQFAFAAMRALPGSLRYFSEIMRLNAIITRRTTVLTFAMAAFLGASVANFGFFLLRSLGASDLVGIIPGLLTPRQLGPQMFAYVLAGSVCCAIAAELGSAKIQQEVSAYESEGVDPMEFLVGTRILAVVLYVPCAAMVTLFGMGFGSFLTVVVILEGNVSTQFIDSFFSIFPLRSMLWAPFMMLVLALQCVLVACFYGMRTVGGPDAVGGAVARSLGVNLVLLHVVLSTLGLIIYNGSLGLPVGD